MAIKTIDDTNLKQIANAIREKTGSTEGISVDEMPEQIKGIGGESTGGGGANIETCSITITTPTSAENCLYVSRFIDGEESHQALANRGSFGTTDVIRGRLFVLYSNDVNSWMGHSITTSDNLEVVYGTALAQGGSTSSFVCTSGESATITLTAIDV